MKKLAAMVLLVLLLTGCANARQSIDRGMELRSQLLKGQGCSFTADITADYGDVLYSFRLECRGDSAGDLAFTVTEPESIASITGTVSGDGGALTFDDTALEFPLMADGQLTPVSAPWIFLKTLRGGYLAAASQEDDLLRLTIHDSYQADALVLDIWLDGENIPVRGEIFYGERRILSLQIEDFTIS